MATPKIIGLYSPAPGSGKSTAAAMLSEILGAPVKPFAAPLKATVHAFLHAAGYSHAQIAMIAKDYKEARLEAIAGHPTYRHLVQTIGTDWGRNLIDWNVWVCMWKFTAGETTIADDMRFENEYATIKELGGECWMIRRPGQENNGTHASEGRLDDFQFDCIIENNGSLEDLRVKVQQAFQESPF